MDDGIYKDGLNKVLHKLSPVLKFYTICCFKKYCFFLSETCFCNNFNREM